MNEINLLDKSVFNRISAGEVVERPASVVKELIENALDAGATGIKVAVNSGGTSFISVADNGCGIESSQLKRAFYPHATSKISKAEDLESITSLGFRGEALPSIGAVSKATIVSKPKAQETGYAVDCIGGEISEIYEYPGSDGTVVIVKDLFYNTPARLKFLKSVRAEEGEITNTVLKTALSRPEVSLTLSLDGKTVLETFGGGLKECISCVYGTKTLENCYGIEGGKNGIGIEGYVGKISFTKPTRSFQTLIVNGRLVTDATVSAAVANAYGSYLMKRQYPFYVLSLSVPFEAVDVNVHPRKAEVRFSDNQIIYSAVYTTVSRVLDGTAAALEIIKEDGLEGFSYKDESKGNTGKTQEDTKVFEEAPSHTESPDIKEGPKLSRAVPGRRDYAGVSEDEIFGEAEKDREKGVDVFAENKKYIERLEKERKEEELRQQNIETDEKTEYIGQVFETYLIFRKGDDMLLIDQHAAHERLLYDELCVKAKQGKTDSQALLVPYTFNVSGDDFMSIYTRLDYFKALGIEIEPKGGDSFSVSAVPCDLCEINLKDFFDDILYDNAFKRETIPTTLREKLMQKACKHAIKGGYRLSQTDIDALITKLNGNFGLRCPHGRPVAVKISRREIEKWFKRTV